MKFDYDSIKEPLADRLPDSLLYLQPILSVMYKNDQMFRSVTDRNLLANNWDRQNSLDSTNEKQLIKIIKRHGWLDIYQIGLKGSLALSITLQHSSQKTQENTYCAIKKVISDTMSGLYDIAMLEDRINVHRNRKQYFGSQLYYDRKTKEYLLYPLHNVDSVNYYRNKIGLVETLEEYLSSSFNIKWDKESYKKQLPALMKRFSFSDSASVYYQQPLPNFIKNEWGF